MPVKVGIRRNEGETWRECAIRYGRRFGLQREITEMYDAAIKHGEIEEQAAWGACLEWDVADVIKEQ